MKSATKLTLALGLTTILSGPALAIDTLITIPALSGSDIVSIAATNVLGNPGLFQQQTALSVGSVATAILAPGVGGGGGTEPVQLSVGGQLVYDSLGNPVYGSLPQDACFGACAGDFMAYDSNGHWIGDFYSSDLIESSASAEPIVGTTSLSGVETLTNLSGSALNSFTANVESFQFDLQGSLPLAMVSQTAIADGSDSLAQLTVPNVTEGMTTMSNTALGAVNTISVSVVTPPNF